jgi:hypothetical protein
VPAAAAAAAAAAAFNMRVQTESVLTL